MARLSIRRELGRFYWHYFFLALVIVVPLTLVCVRECVNGTIAALSRGQLLLSHVVGLGVLGILLACFVGVALFSANRLIQIDLFRHPSLLGLARYGPVQELVNQIDRELANESRVVTVGSLLRSFQVRHTMPSSRSFQLVATPRDPLGSNAVWLTPSWLIYARHQGTDLQFMRLANVVAAFRDEMGLMERSAWMADIGIITAFQKAAKVVLVDRFDVRVQISGTEDGLTQLLAEILLRVPWALSHFDTDTHRRWTENRQAIITQVDQRREQIHDPAAPPIDLVNHKDNED